jgi:hypothetical protein
VVELTEAGRRFLPPARQFLAGGDRAVAAARHTSRPLRVVWGHLYAPMRTVGQVIAGTPELSTEVGLIWRSQDQHPMLGVLLQRFAEIGSRPRWLEYGPARDWLPRHDYAELSRLGYAPDDCPGI